MTSGQRLTEQQRHQILELVCMEQLTFDDIAARVGVCTRTVAIVVRRYAGQCWERERADRRIEQLRNSDDP